MQVLVAVARLHRRATGVLVLGAALGLAACGGGGGGDAPAASPPVSTAPVPAPTAPAPPAAPSGAASAPAPTVAAERLAIRLDSAAGDPVGQGNSYSYGFGSAVVRVSTRGGWLSLRIEGRERWTGEFLLPGNTLELTPGRYENLARYPFQATGAGALSWSGQGRSCNVVAGSIEIRSVRYTGGVLEALDMGFEQRCDGAAGVLRGDIRIDAEAMARLVLPSNPLPENPVIALRSDTGDFIGGGGRYAYDHRSAVLTVSAVGPLLSVHVEGDEHWRAQFLMPGNATALVPGVYGELSRYPFQPAGSGALDWSGEGRGCNSLRGQMEIRSVRYEAGVLRAIDLGFEQFCERGSTALRGDIRWDADVVTPPFEPGIAPPAAQWTSPAGLFPPTGNAMYLVSEPGDYVGDGYEWRVGAAAGAPLAPGEAPPTQTGYATVDVSGTGGKLRVRVTGLVDWWGDFEAPRSAARLQPGYYGVLQRYPFNNPARGGLSWSMGSRGCNELTGWFVIDRIRYEGDEIREVELRFTQYCDNSIAPLRAHIRWGPQTANTALGAQGAASRRR